ncbi:MAG: metal ABC transporter ATP-binding protein [Psychromonas sp.]|nr:metal ABC transporter ATP-binding protein [Alteromonadales bacterium]MCP5078685.1 metal ABC transporter ATP-binding protein [Psychromonas sp.]
MGPVVNINGVNLSYANNPILSDINLTLQSGLCHMFMGPNGGGKTSLLRSILGLTPFTGSVELQWPDKQGKVGYVPQKALFESSLPLSVLDFILLNQSSFPLFWRQRKKQQQHAMLQLDRVGMASRATRRMGLLSGGEQQRVLFAQALLSDPELYLLDEPTTGMDEQGVRYLEGLIEELVADKKTVIAVHHDISAVRRLQAQVHVVNKSIIRSGEAKQILKPENIEQLFSHHSTFSQTSVGIA